MPRSPEKRHNKKNTTRFLFVVEGHTEEDYLKLALGVSVKNLHVVENPRYTDLENLVKIAIKNWEGPGGYEKVFVLFDKDKLDSTDPVVQRVQNLLVRTDENVIAVCSSPLFEYVLLLHFEPTKHPPLIPNSVQVLRPHGYPNHKTSPHREKLMKFLKENPAKIKVMDKTLKNQDKNLGLCASTPLMNRLHQDNCPNSNFHIVLAELQKEKVLSFTLESTCPSA